MPEPIDPEAFRDFEYAGWQKFARGYHDNFAKLTTQVIGPLLDAVNVGEGVRALDIATGAGYAAAAAAERGAVVIGVDFSEVQVAMAREQYPKIAFREGDAEALPFDDESFDVVTINFGMLHFPQPERAVAEANRVLRAGGRIGFTVWATPAHAKGFAIVLRAIEEHGDSNVPLPPGPPFFRFSDSDECRRVLTEGGFEQLEFTQVAQIWRFPSPHGFFKAFHEGTPRTGALLRAQHAEVLETIRMAIVEAASAYETKGIIEIPMPAVLASAIKP